MEDIITLYVPDCSIFTKQAETVELTMYPYSTGSPVTVYYDYDFNLVANSMFKDQILEDYCSGSTIGDIYLMTMEDFMYIKEGQGEFFDAIIYNYYSGIPLVAYSGSTLGDMGNFTLGELARTFIG